MKKQKLTLDNLSIRSFVANMDQSGTLTIKGGETFPLNCNGFPTWNCTEANPAGCQ